LRRGERKRPQQDAVHQAEDGAIGADAERKRDHDDSSESRIPEQQAQGAA